MSIGPSGWVVINEFESSGSAGIINGVGGEHFFLWFHKLD